MRLRFKFNADPAIAHFGEIGDRADNAGAILKRWGGYLRKRNLARADEAQGWAPLAESTQKRYAATRTAPVTAHGKVRKSYAKRAERALARAEKIAGWNQNARTGALRRLAQKIGVSKTQETQATRDLAELRRLVQGGRVDRQRTKSGKLSSRAAAWQGSKAVQRLRGQLARAQAAQETGKGAPTGGKRKSDAHKPLGLVARQLQYKADGARVSLFSKVPWSAIHNEGGTAGHGARIPARLFLDITQEDELVLAEIVEQHLAGKQ